MTNEERDQIIDEMNLAESLTALDEAVRAGKPAVYNGDRVAEFSIGDKVIALEVGSMIIYLGEITGIHLTRNGDISYTLAVASSQDKEKWQEVEVEDSFTYATMGDLVDINYDNDSGIDDFVGLLRWWPGKEAK